MSPLWARGRIAAMCAGGLFALAAIAPAATTTTVVSARSRTAHRTTLWCVVEAEYSGDPASLSPAALKDLKGAGFDGVVLEGHSGMVVARSKEAGLVTTGIAALRVRSDAAFTSATLDYLRGAGRGLMPSAYARAILSLQKSSLGPAVLVPGDDSIRGIAREIFNPRDAAQTDLAQETLSAIADTILVAIPGDVAWPQSSIQKTQSSAASRRLLAMRRDLLRAHTACAALRDGTLRTLVADDQDQVLAFARIARSPSAAVVIVNNTERQRRVGIPGERMITQGAPEGLEMKLVSTGGDAQATPGRVRVAPATFRVSRGMVEVDLAPRTAALYVTEK